MSAKCKTVLKGFTYMHCDDFAKYLSNMAAKGWHFKEWGAGLKFEKGEPEQAVYAVEVFTKASENDLRPEPNTQEFAEYCEAAGWKFIDAKQKYCIFKKVDENAVELFTPEERVTNAFKGTVSGINLLLFFLYGLNAVLQWIRLFGSFEIAIFSDAYLVNLAIWNVMFLGQFITFTQAFWKKHKLIRGIRRGREVYLGNRRDGKFRLSWNDIYIGILVLLLMYYFFAMDRVEIIVVNAIIVGVTVGFGIIMNRIRPERDTYVVVQIGFSMVLIVTIVALMIGVFGNETVAELEADDLPVLISDYREETDEVVDLISYYHEENVFGSMDKYNVYYEEEIIHYYVYQSTFAGILDKVWDDILSKKRFNEDAVDCTGDWNAEKAVRNKLGTYYVRYDNAVLEFSDDEEVYLTDEQIDIILDKLGLR